MTRLLFTAVSAHGHLLLMAAGLGAGHHVAVMVSSDLSDVVEAELPRGVELLPAGPMPLELAMTAAERTGGDVLHPSIAGVGETFGGVLLDLSLDPATAAARTWQPDVIVSDMYNTVGPFLAATRDVPWHRFVMSVAPPADWTAAIDAAAGRRYATRALVPKAPASTVQIWPEHLTASDDDQWTDAPVTRMAFTAHSGREPRSRRHVAGPPTSRPQVVASLGTIFSDSDALDLLTETLDGLDLDVTITRGLALGQDEEPGARDVRSLSFTPMADLLENADVVVTVGGAGTVLAALSEGIPLVVWPRGADQPRIAERVVAAGAGVRIDSLDALPSAVARTLHDQSLKSAARAIATDNAGRLQPDQVVASIAERRPGV